MHSEATLMETTLNMTQLGHVNEHSVFLCETPMFHVIGLVSCVRPALYCGGSLVISDPETGYWMALEAFGTDNRRVFAEILQRANSLELIASFVESAE